MAYITNLMPRLRPVSQARTCIVQGKGGRSTYLPTVWAIELPAENNHSLTALAYFVALRFSNNCPLSILFRATNVPIEHGHSGRRSAVNEVLRTSFQKAGNRKKTF